MELRFGCLVTKRTHFRDAPADAPGTQSTDACLWIFAPSSLTPAT
jgi:hypothetical protein